MAEPNLKIQMDFYHAQIVEGDIAKNIKRYFNHIAHIQGWNSFATYFSSTAASPTSGAL